jgi:hypothetical protein
MESAGNLIKRTWLPMVLLAVVAALVLAVPMIFARSDPPPQSWADGVYYNDCCAPLTLRGGVITVDGRSSSYTVESSKFGYCIDIPAGISVQSRQVRFGGNSVFVFFNRVSALDPAVHEARSLHISGRDDSIDYVFEKR